MPVERFAHRAELAKVLDDLTDEGLRQLFIAVPGLRLRRVEHGG
jgi:hypothetical protein